MKVEELVASAQEAYTTRPGSGLRCAPMPDEQCERVVRAVLTCLLDDPTMSRETRRYLEAILQQNRSPVEGGPKL